MTPVVRKLRRQPTEAEERLWYHLRARRLGGFKFRRQHPLLRHAGDFCCEEARLIVEVDGGQHAESECDLVRTASIEAAGYQLIRFWNHEVLAETDAVLEAILEALRVAMDR